MYINHETDNLEKGQAEEFLKAEIEEHDLHHYAYCAVPFDFDSVKRDLVWKVMMESLAKGGWAVERTGSYLAWGYIMARKHDSETGLTQCVMAVLAHHELALNWHGNEPRTSNELQSSEVFTILADAIYNNSEILEDDKLTVNFWYKGSQSVSQQVRNLSCPTWDEIKENYPANSSKLKCLMEMEEPYKKGQIILWHGVPGTGKTYAIRALFQEWDRMTVNVIVDPEKFLGDAEYLHQVAFSMMPEEDPEDDYFGDHAARTSLARHKNKKKPRNKGALLVLEDAADFILAENRASIGAHISRLLNLTDGLIGQGLQLVVLVTTNEKLGEIDPAVIRPGRCLQVLEFPDFTETQSSDWLGEGHKDANSQTLAHLYAKKNGHEVGGVDQARLGFDVKPTPASSGVDWTTGH